MNHVATFVAHFTSLPMVGLGSFAAQDTTNEAIVEDGQQYRQIGRPVWA
jgi:hypothetical protein